MDSNRSYLSESVIPISYYEKSWQDMSIEQQVQYTNTTKAKAAVMIIEASHFYQESDYEKAKQLFVQIAQNCMKIKEPDEQILKWIQTSYSCLGIIYRRDQQRKKRIIHGSFKTQTRRENVLVLEYNKFSGEFQMEKGEDQRIGLQNRKAILQYISKINMILFGCQNVENNHSLYIMFSSYWVAFVFALTLLVIGLIFLSTNDVFPLKITQSSLEMEIPSVIIGALLILPLLMIYLKNIEQKDNNFFQKKLGEEIKRINEDCKLRNNKLQFMMPHGREINIWMGQEEEESQDNNIIPVQVIQTPEDQLMNKFKGLTRQASKMSNASVKIFK